MPTPVIAFVPVLNGGVRELSNFAFRSGVRLTASSDPESVHIHDITLQSLSGNHFVSPMEVRTLDMARGMLWVQGIVPESDPRAVIGEASRLSILLQNLLWCIYCHPFGENTYWRHLNFNSVVYVDAELGAPLNAPRRIPFLYGVPNGEQATLTGWSDQLLGSADTLAAAIEDYQHRVPRVFLSGQLHRLMASIDVLQNWPARLQLAVTALETLFIAPPERLHLWSTPTQARVLSTGAVIQEGYFERLREVRNDIVHRAGLSNSGSVAQGGVRVLIETEIILRDTLRWALSHLGELDAAFSSDTWPF